jgi:hypothetical protein
MTRKIQPLTIFEGPDCSGKSTVAMAFQQTQGLGARLIHHGPYKQVDGGQLPRVYVDHMIPMFLGYEAQVWDRCWLSEPIYGQAYRDGQDRIGRINQRHLERFALRHGAVVVLCLPPWETVKEKWEERHAEGGEMLDKLSQLEQVYEGYRNLPKTTSLPVVNYDYTSHELTTLWTAICNARARDRLHTEVLLRTAGSATASVALVGEKPSDMKTQDSVIQVPFASFSGLGSSQWLTSQLEAIGVQENQLFWINASDDVALLKKMHLDAVFGLGTAASHALELASVNHIKVDHPQHHRRFKSSQPYKLLECLNDYFNA